MFPNATDDDAAAQLVWGTAASAGTSFFALSSPRDYYYPDANGTVMHTTLTMLLGLSSGDQSTDAPDYAYPLLASIGELHMIVGILCVACVAVLAAGSGLGGGGVLVPLYVIVMRFEVLSAVAMSEITIMGGAFGNLLLNTRKTHPHAARPMISWDLLLSLEPLTILGTVAGSFINKIFPKVATLFLMLCLYSSMAARGFFKGSKALAREGKELKQAAEKAAKERSRAGNDGVDNAQPKNDESVDPIETTHQHASLAEAGAVAGGLKEPLLASHRPNVIERSASDRAAAQLVPHATADSADTLPNKIAGRPIMQRSPLGTHNSSGGFSAFRGGDAADLPRGTSIESVRSDDDLSSLGSFAGISPTGGPRLKRRGMKKSRSGNAISLLTGFKRTASFLFYSNMSNNSLTNLDDLIEIEDAVDERGKSRSPPYEGKVVSDRLRTDRRFSNALRRGNVEVAGELFREANMIPLGKFFAMLSVSCIEIATLLSRQKYTMCGTLTFWIATGACFVGIFIVVATFYRHLAQHRRMLLAIEYEPATGDEFAPVNWTNGQSSRYMSAALFGGFISSWFGVGGGIVMGPLFLEIGTQPEVAMATCSTTIFFTSFAATVSYISMGVMPMEYGALGFAIGFVFTMIGQYFTTLLIRKTKRPSLLILIFSSIATLSCVGVIYMEYHTIRGVVVDDDLDGVKFHVLCPK